MVDSFQKYTLSQIGIKIAYPTRVFILTMLLLIKMLDENHPMREIDMDSYYIYLIYPILIYPVTGSLFLYCIRTYRLPIVRDRFFYIVLSEYTSLVMRMIRYASRGNRNNFCIKSF